MKKIFLLFGLCIFSYALVGAQDLSNPYETIFTHLDNLQKDNYNPEVSASVIPSAIEDEQRRIELAIHLKQILDGKGLFIQLNALPHDPNYTDSTLNKNIYTIDPLEPRIYLEKTGDKWLYSMETIKQVDEMYAEVFPFGTKIFSRLLPPSVRNKHVLGLSAWQWLGLLVVILLGVVGRLIVHKLVIWALHYAIYRKEIISAENEDVLKKIAQSFSLLVVFYLISIIAPSLQLPPLILQYIVKTITILLTFLGAALVIRVFALVLVYFKPHVENTESKLDDQLLPIVSKLFKIVVAIVAFSIALKQLDVNLTAILAGLSIGGLAVALASQDTVKNFIGTITILLDHPFEIGDYIQISGLEGTVEEVGMRATRIRTPAQSLAYIPNADLSNMIVDNLGLRIYRRWKWSMGVEYGTKPAKLKELCEKAREVVNQNSWVAADKTIIQLNELAGSSINILMLIYLDVESYDKELASKHELLLQLITLADEMKVEFAFPTQTLHLKQ